MGGRVKPGHDGFGGVFSIQLALGDLPEFGLVNGVWPTAPAYGKEKVNPAFGFGRRRTRGVGDLRNDPGFAPQFGTPFYCGTRPPPPPLAVRPGTRHRAAHLPPPPDL